MIKRNSFDCDECREHLAEFALDELPSEEAAAIAQHLADGCESCNERLTEIVDGLTTLSATLPLVTPPAHIEHDLMRRILLDVHSPPSVSTPVLEPSNTNGDGLWKVGLIGAAMAASLLAVLAWTTWSHGPEERLSARAGRRQPQLERRMHAAEQSRQVSLMSSLEFSPGKDQIPEASAKMHVHGHIVVDRAAGQWHVYLFNLPVLPEDHRYQAWFVTGPSQFVAAGKLDVDSQGSAGLILEVPADSSQITGIAISDEPVGGSQQPTGRNFFETAIQ